jgi:RNAse (barnase) inhibitor barstar
MLIFVSSNITYATSVFEVKAEKVQLMEQIKEKRQIIKQHKKVNAKLEKQVEKKSKDIEVMLVTVGKSNLVLEQQFESKFGERLDVIMDELMGIGNLERAMWKHLKMANRQIKSEKYEAGLKNLDRAINELEKKYKILIELDKSLDELSVFLKSVQYK